MSEIRRAASTAVIQRLADHKGIEPDQLETRLFDVIDPDGLDRLFASCRDEATGFPEVRFTYESYEVIVHAPDDIELNQLET